MLYDDLARFFGIRALRALATDRPNFDSHSDAHPQSKTLEVLRITRDSGRGRLNRVHSCVSCVLQKIEPRTHDDGVSEIPACALVCKIRPFFSCLDSGETSHARTTPRGAPGTTRTDRHAGSRCGRSRA